jgi:hypothetical protein
MEPIKIDDLILINNLSSRDYTVNSLLSNATEDEKNQLDTAINKLKVLADYFAEKYYQAYGPFETSVTTGNSIAIGEKHLKEFGLEYLKEHRINNMLLK